jgi:hypothetical protein
VKLCIASVTYHGCDPDHALSVFELLMQPGVSIIYRGDDGILERARSIVATRFLQETDADVLLSIDADIIFRAADAVAIGQQAITHSMVGGIYTMRTPHGPWPVMRMYRDEPVVLSDDPTPIRVPAVGTGFLATHRRVFEAMIDRAGLQLQQSEGASPFYPFYLYAPAQVNGRWQWLGEDIAFCELARRAGFDTYVNPAIRLQHVGRKAFTLDDMLPRSEPRLQGAARLAAQPDGSWQLVNL